LERRLTRLARGHMRLAALHPRQKLALANDRAKAIATRLTATMNHRIERRRAHLGQLARALHAVSPLATLARGYSILIDSDSGAVVHSVAQTSPDSRLRGIVADGELRLRIDNSN
ncbi:MAG TPA: exodeoxyribonuclease VII large subunit, partial [Dokdonella sp.]|uniref:exodeoxyribonuclease VII large subunit n=1 Tax=Dokdonella sp. TaxID=2291710 RepID=UPI002D7F84B5